MVKFGSRLSFPGSPPSLALSPAGDLFAHIKTQSSIQDLWYNDPIQDTTNVRRAGRIGRRRPERIRSAFRKSRLHQITTNGKEGCGTEGHADGITGENPGYQPQKQEESMSKRLLILMCSIFLIVPLLFMGCSGDDGATGATGATGADRTAVGATGGAGLRPSPGRVL